MLCRFYQDANLTHAAIGTYLPCRSYVELPQGCVQCARDYSSAIVSTLKLQQREIGYKRGKHHPGGREPR